MNRDIAQEWAQALKSGKYKQGKNKLSHKGEEGEWHFCATGVLAETRLRI